MVQPQANLSDSSKYEDGFGENEAETSSLPELPDMVIIIMNYFRTCHTHRMRKKFTRARYSPTEAVSQSRELYYFII
jgi:hypothetical protein